VGGYGIRSFSLFLICGRIWNHLILLCVNLWEDTVFSPFSFHSLWEDRVSFRFIMYEFVGGYGILSFLLFIVCGRRIPVSSCFQIFKFVGRYGIISFYYV
jgi:hypothetical protein